MAPIHNNSSLDVETLFEANSTQFDFDVSSALKLDLLDELCFVQDPSLVPTAYDVRALSIQLSTTLPRTIGFAFPD